jgi:hypothetical protein
LAGWAAVKLGKRFAIRAEYEGWDVAKSLDAWSIGLSILLGGNSSEGLRNATALLGIGQER